MRAIDLTGFRTNMLTVISMAPNQGKKTAWLARCECGVEKEIATGDLRSKRLVSCGCHKNKLVIERNKQSARHGLTGTRTYITWMNMLRRCDYPKDKCYYLYGGRGISVCKDWYDFTKFYADMGERPKGKTLDRIDPNGNYEKSNCRWATLKEQAKNKRKKLCV